MLTEDLLVGLVALGLVPAIGRTIFKGQRSGRLPIGRAYVRRDERAGAFSTLLALYVAALILVGAIAADLLLGLGLRQAL